MNFEEKRCVVITGVTGFVGSALTLSYLNDGYKVYGIGRNTLKFGKFENYRNFIPVVADLKNSSTISDYIKEEKIDAFIHLANNGVNGINKSDYMLQIENLRISCDMVILAKKLSCQKFIFAGSMDEYYAHSFPDYHYQTPNHTSYYGMSKYAAEKMCKDLCYREKIHYIGVVAPLVYGIGNATNNLPNTIIRASFNNKTVKLIEGNNFFDMISIEDCVKAYRQLEQKGHSMESYYIGHRKFKIFKEQVYDICRCIDSKIKLEFGAYPDADISFDFSLIDTNKAFQDAQYECSPDMKESIQKTYEWIRGIEV